MIHSRNDGLEQKRMTHNRKITGRKQQDAYIPEIQFADVAALPV